LRTPKVSICLPVYNAEHTLRNTLNSVLNQTEPNWELIIQDNASKDQSWEIISSFVTEHPSLRIKTVRLSKTVSAEENWYSCIRQTTADWIKLLFADDLIYPTCLEKQLEVAEHNSGVVIIFGKRDVISMKGKLLIKSRGLGRLRARFDRTQLCKEILATGTNPLGEPSMVLFSKKASQRVGGFCRNNPYLVDLDYWVRILSEGDGFALDFTVGAFRIANGSGSIRLIWQQSPLFRQFLRKLSCEGLIKLNQFGMAVAALRSILLAGSRAALYIFLRLTRI